MEVRFKHSSVEYCPHCLPRPTMGEPIQECDLGEKQVVNKRSTMRIKNTSPGTSPPPRTSQQPHDPLGWLALPLGARPRE